MGWMSNLYNTYNSILESDAAKGTNTESLIPIAHIVQKAQLHVVVSKEGEFLRAEIVGKDEQNTTIPVTATSSSRANSPEPHGLHDNLWYVAGDLANYLNPVSNNDSLEANKEQKKIKEQYGKYFQPYITQLEEWCKSSEGNWKVKSVYNYLNKETLATDLIRSNLLQVLDGHLVRSAKIEKIVQEKAFVRFSVEAEGILHNLWKDKAVAEDYISFYMRQLDSGEKSLCYITGIEGPIAKTHGKYIRWPGDGAKLVSSNDTTNFTYRGRLLSADECVQISYVATEKAHSALRWLIQQNGVSRDGYTVVAWTQEGVTIPNPMEDTEDLLKVLDDTSDRIDSLEADVGSYYARELGKAVRSLKADLQGLSGVSIMAVDAATEGRMSILYYRELGGGEYIDRLRNWHEHTAWIHQYKKDEAVDKWYRFVGAPSLVDIVLVACGHEQNKRLSVDSKIGKYQIDRLLPCVIDKARLPEDLVKGAVIRASNPRAMTPFNWQKCLSVTCSLIRKYRWDRFGEEWSMELESNGKNTDRSYLFGRLLAVADIVESWALRNMKVDRLTAAMRYMDAFSKRPSKTWMTIEKGLVPYFAKLNPWQRAYCTKAIDEIMGLLKIEEYAKHQGLDERYLLGYHHQKQDMMKKKDKGLSNQLYEDKNQEERNVAE